MTINIPDKIYKFLILLGIGMFIYGFFEQNSIHKKITESSSIIDQRLIEISGLTKSLEQAKIISVEKLGIICSNNNLENTISLDTLNNKNNLNFNFNIPKGDNYNEIYNATFKEWNYINQKMLDIKSKIHLADVTINYYLEDVDQLNLDYNALEFFLFLGGFLFLLGLGLWILDEEQSIKNKINSDKVYNFCQSCGSNFNSVRTNGTNADNSINLGFCIECLDKGNFIFPNMTKEEFFQKVELDIFQKNRLEKYKLRKHYRNLERWNIRSNILNREIPAE